MRKFSIPIILLFIIFLFFLFSIEVGYSVEVEYPEIEGWRPETTEPGEFDEYIRYVARFLTILASLIAFGALIYSGFMWITSAGEPLKLQESKRRIIASLAGLLIILSSYILLGSISPSLVTLVEMDVEVVEEIHSPGVYLSLSGQFHDGNPELIMENVRKINSSEAGLGGLQGEIKALRIVNPTEDDKPGSSIVYRHLVVLHGEENFRGECTLLTTSNAAQEFTITSPEREKMASISIARVEAGGDPYGGVIAYDRPEFRQGSGWQTLTPTGTTLQSLSIDGVWSVAIEGSYAVILAGGANWNQMNANKRECALFATSTPLVNLTGHYMNRCNPYWYSAFFAAYESCSTHYALFPLYRR